MEKEVEMCKRRAVQANVLSEKTLDGIERFGDSHRGKGNREPEVFDIRNVKKIAQRGSHVMNQHI
jgi:hypothetical protein